MLLKLNLQRFAGASMACYFNFDNHITKITDSNGSSVTTSGGYLSDTFTSLSGTYTVELEDGYVIDNVTIDGGTVTNKTDNAFTISLTDRNGANAYVTITSKKSTSQVSIDLTSLLGWGNVADGDHVIQVVAKADGYRDSEKSTSVSFTKGSASVTLSAGTYKFNETLNIAKGTDIGQSITGKMNTLSAMDTYGETKDFVLIGVVNVSQTTSIPSINILDETEENFISYEGGDWKYYDNTGETYNVTDTTKLRTITIETDQQVSQEFKTWFDNNTTVASSFTQIPITKSSQSVWTTISNLDQTKVYTIGGQTNYPADQYAQMNKLCTLKYVNNQWTAETFKLNCYINVQTSNSISFNVGVGAIPSGASPSSSYVWLYGFALEGTNEATQDEVEYWSGERTQNIARYICLIEGTLVTLADGTTKPIEDITYDDELLVWNFYDGKFDKAKPCWVTKPQIAHEYNLCKFSNGVEIGFVGQGGDIGYHRIYNDELKSFTHTGVKETPIGTHTFAQDGSKPTLVEQHIVNKQVRYYNVGTQKHINIFTNGILTSSRLSNKYAIENMKYVGDRLISEQEEQEYIERTLKRC